MKESIYSFDGTEAVKAKVLRPDRYKELYKNLSENNSTIARGAGLSYGSPSFGDGVISVSTQLFNRIIHFDEQKGLIQVEAGITIGDLLDIVISKGWNLPVLPGYPLITIGGCVAFNVHGKSQFHDGNFLECIEKIWLYHPDKGELTLKKSENSELFYLTVGGMGLTGFITQVEIKLQKLKGNCIKIQRIAVKNLEDAVKIMEQNSSNADMLYSWNNLNLKGACFGKGFVYIENYVNKNIKPKSTLYGKLDYKIRRKLPINFFNRILTPLILFIYMLKEQLISNMKVVDVKTASFPINGKEIYYKLFGKRGFREFQFLVPKKNWNQAIIQIKHEIVTAGVPITLGSLKLFKGQTTNLNFCGDGICMALNMPESVDSRNLIDNLLKIVLKNNGIINLSKDSITEKEDIIKMYPEYAQFKKNLNEFDSKKRFDSSLRRRIDV